MEYFYFWDKEDKKWYVDVTEISTPDLCRIRDNFKKYSYEVSREINKIIIDRHLNITVQNHFCGINEYEKDQLYKMKKKCKGRKKSNGKY